MYIIKRSKRGAKNQYCLLFLYGSLIASSVGLVYSCPMSERFSKGEKKNIEEKRREERQAII